MLSERELKNEKDSSLVVYTVTAAIAIALLIYVVTPSSNVDEFEWLKTLSASALAVSIVLIFLSIEYLFDITSLDFKIGRETKHIKYKLSLIFYNLSVILMLLAVFAIFIDYLLGHYIFLYPRPTWISLTIIYLVVARKWITDSIDVAGMPKTARNRH